MYFSRILVLFVTAVVYSQDVIGSPLAIRNDLAEREVRDIVEAYFERRASSTDGVDARRAFWNKEAEKLKIEHADRHQREREAKKERNKPVKEEKGQLSDRAREKQGWKEEQEEAQKAIKDLKNAIKKS
ncbi:hypothetical protein CPB83DRAFT_881778 [Crepidotus variabilis]|uniref:Uncharacterized protein n=1 Tax=Crepidotus variabilis TaxID=179855 RepID=A0A9P6EKR4_9AGAR|nr:hypothetical protein CPB83DRAFT_881778 [Crepidotus variabilis]